MSLNNTLELLLMSQDTPNSIIDNSPMNLLTGKIAEIMHDLIFSLRISISKTFKQYLQIFTKIPDLQN